MKGEEEMKNGDYLKIIEYLKKQNRLFDAMVKELELMEKQIKRTNKELRKLL